MFGQEVLLSIEDANERPILDLLGLRVDFDIRKLDGFGRGSVTVYNLNEQTIGNLIGNNSDHYLTLKTRLHGGQEFTIADRYFINNTIDEKKIPDTITTLYCYDSLKKDVLEKQVNLKVDNPTLRNQVSQMLNAVGYTGQVNYKSFPSSQEDMIPPRPKVQLNDSVSRILEDLKKEFNFNYYTSTNGLTFIYLPDLKQVGLTDLDERKPLVLDVNNMRANPKLAPAQLQIVSNLDAGIVPGEVLDISNLLTAAVGSDEEALQLAKDFAKDSIAGYGRYQVLSVQHTGSNYTAQWHTIATAVAPTRGLNMPTQVQTWSKGR